MLATFVFSASLILQPLAPSRPARSCARTPSLVTASILEKTRSGTLTEIQPGARYRTDEQPAKYYEGPTPANKAALKKAMKDIGKRKLVIITGASSGLGLFCFEALLAKEVCIDSHASAGLPDAAASAACAAMCLICTACVVRVAEWHHQQRSGLEQAGCARATRTATIISSARRRLSPLRPRARITTSSRRFVTRPRWTRPQRRREWRAPTTQLSSCSSPHCSQSRTLRLT